MAEKINVDEIYREKFGEPPPIFGYDKDKQTQMILAAINSGTPITPLSEYIPDGADL